MTMSSKGDDPDCSLSLTSSRDIENSLPVPGFESWLGSVKKLPVTWH